MIYFIGWLLVFLLVVIIFTKIVDYFGIFIPKPRLDLLNLQYTDSTDLWYKTDGNKKLIVFLHGMYSTPSTFEDYASHWTNLNPSWDIYIPALPAGTKDREELRRLGPWTWEESTLVAEAKILASIKGYDTVVLGGHSQGGSLALNVASKHNLFNALIIIASPLVLGGSNLSWDDNLGIAFAGLLCLLLPKGVNKPVPYTEERRSVEKPCDAEGLIFPLTIHSFKRGLAMLRNKTLANIKAPLFMAYCDGDKMVNFRNADLLQRSVSSSVIVRKNFNIPQKTEPYGRRHQLLNYSFTKKELTQALDEFLQDF